ncbi:MAG: pyridoxal-phosphate dependent enzyme [Rhodobacteraceae bacterium]|nr:pyridoxal-phosphate dependent enzyme [Paracoccaceae bacterium]
MTPSPEFLPELPPGIRFDPDAAAPRRLLRDCPAYRPSPLQTVDLGGGRTLLLKDETTRMSLGSFKALGGIYAVARLIEKRWRTAFPDTADPIDFTSDPVRSFAASLTFVCASAGNHGLSVAAGARIFGAQSRIHLSGSVPEGFVGRLTAQNAKVVRSGDTYEESLKAAEQDAVDTGAILLADGSWPGHTEPPSLVMEGYTVIAEEMRESFEASGQWPTAVYLQAGVGGLAAGIAHMIRLNWAKQPSIIVVEPEAAPCLKESIAQARPVRVEGPISAMGRLDCKEPSLLALDTLKRCADEFVLISEQQADDATAHAATLGLTSTPSGAAGLAAALNDSSDRPLAIISEGAA